MGNKVTKRAYIRTRYSVYLVCALQVSLACSGELTFSELDGSLGNDVGMADDSSSGRDGGAVVDGGVSKDSGGPIAEEPTDLKGILAAHNAVRDTVGTAHLTWDPALAAIAQAYSEKCVWEHNPNRGDTYPESVGENLYASSNKPSGAGVVDSWASEVQYYDYASNSCSGVCGHYTQVVWNTTTKVGCGIAHCPQIQGLTWSSGGYIVTCNYSLAGNNGSRPY